MKGFFVTSLAFGLGLSVTTLSQPIQIPIVPFDDKPPYVSYKLHRRCKHTKDYGKCIDRSKRRVISSIDMDY